MFVLSEKSNQVVAQYTLDRPIYVKYDDSLLSSGRMNSNNPDCYEIWLNLTIITEDTFDEVYLHEYFHCPIANQQIFQKYLQQVEWGR